MNAPCAAIHLVAAVVYCCVDAGALESIENVYSDTLRQPCMYIIDTDEFLRMRGGPYFYLYGYLEAAVDIKFNLVEFSNNVSRQRFADTNAIFEQRMATHRSSGSAAWGSNPDLIQYNSAMFC